MDPEPGVFGDIAKCTGSNDKTSRPGAGKGPSNGDGPEHVLSVVSVHVSSQKLHWSLHLLPQDPAEKQMWFLLPGSFCLMHLVQIRGQHHPQARQSQSIYRCC